MTGSWVGASAAALLAALASGCATVPTAPAARLEIVDRLETQVEIQCDNPAARLVDVATAVEGVALDVRYATANNFMGEVLYPAELALLRAPAAEALARVQAELAEQGLGLVVFDAYRPYRVTVRMWEKIGDPDYVADPAKGSRHNRGAAVDVTLARLADGVPLEMPTDYDDFSPRAHHNFQEFSDEVKANRALLRQVMEQQGFEALASEWWHYDFAGWREFDLLDLDLLAVAEVPGCG